MKVHVSEFISAYWFTPVDIKIKKCFVNVMQLNLMFVLYVPL